MDNGEKSSRGLFRPPAELQSSTSVIVESEVKQPKKFWRTRVYSVNDVSKLAKGGQQRAMQKEKAISSPRFGTVNPLLDVAPSVDCLKKIRTKSLSWKYLFSKRLNRYTLIIAFCKALNSHIWNIYKRYGNPTNFRSAFAFSLRNRQKNINLRIRILGLFLVSAFRILAIFSKVL